MVGPYSKNSYGRESKRTKKKWVWNSNKHCIRYVWGRDGRGMEGNGQPIVPNQAKLALHPIAKKTNNYHFIYRSIVFSVNKILLFVFSTKYTSLKQLLIQLSPFKYLRMYASLLNYHHDNRTNEHNLKNENYCLMSHMSWRSAKL